MCEAGRCDVSEEILRPPVHRSKLVESKGIPKERGKKKNLCRFEIKYVQYETNLVDNFLRNVTSKQSMFLECRVSFKVSLYNLDGQT